MVNGNKTWITSHGNPQKLSNTAWLGSREDRHCFFSQVFRARSKFIHCTIFFNANGLVAINNLPLKTTITANYCTKMVAQKIKNSICEQRETTKTSKMLLLHDKKALYKAKVRMTFQHERGTVVSA